MVSALIVAAGRGVRMGAERDKLFLLVAGQPVIAHTWRRFDASPAVDELVLVVREGQENVFDGLARTQGFRKPFRFVRGGAERQDSVWNGISALDPSSEIVLIHDGARPCFHSSLIERTIDAAREAGAAVAAQKVTDTIKESADGVLIGRHLDRTALWSVQTPQTFRVAVIRRALEAVRAKGIQLTDDTAACEFIGQAVKLVPHHEPNPKVTVPADLPYIEWLLSKQE